MGRDLIAAAAVRAQISQIEKYQQAVNTFRGKYGYLPGDIKDPEASSFGFLARGAYPGEGDGNGLIDGVDGDCNTCNGGFYAVGGESLLFWSDLKGAGLATVPAGATSSSVQPPVSGFGVGRYLPGASMARANFIYIWNGGTSISTGINFFGISAVSSMGTGYGWDLLSTPGMTVAEAASIDKKIDDGYPQSGNIMAWYEALQQVPGHPVWAAGGGQQGYNISGLPSNASTPGSATTCYDNNGVGGTTQQYSLTQNGGANVNCALSFKFQ